MKISDFDYRLPEALIATKPPAKRGSSRLLVVNKATGKIDDKSYGDVVHYARAGDVVIVNDTKVIPARLKVHKQSNNSLRELVLVEKHGSQDDWYRHKVLYRQHLSPGDILQTADGSQLHVEEILDNGLALVSCQRDLLEVALAVGEVPLPPYMHRQATAADTKRYQTVWARHAGSVAAPTASLNMTAAMLELMQKRGVKVCYITLHVGLGTFLPIRTENIEKHLMHSEYFEIPLQTIAAIRQARSSGQQIIAVGTTVARTLEYAAPHILTEKPGLLRGEADIFIYPGYHFKIIDSLLTNFHAPRSTVLMLTAAFAGWELLKTAYDHAVEENYHFLSYGDSMLIGPREMEP